MPSIDEREQNLFNATDTVSQFYYEIETFLSILYGNMERSGFAMKAERLRSGTFTTKNLTRRLLATATVIYVKGAGQAEEALDDEEPEEEEEDTKASKKEVAITSLMQLPFIQIALFTPRTIPSVRTLTSPTLYLGAVGGWSFVDKNTEKPANPESPVLALSNLANIRLGSAHKKGDVVTIPCWRPSKMRKYRLEGKLVGFESMKLLEIDSQEKIAKISETLAELSEAGVPASAAVGLAASVLGNASASIAGV
jgi:hypothetical protein